VARGKLDDLGRRVQSLSLLQEKLYRGGDFGRVDLDAFLRQQAAELVARNGRGIVADVVVEAPPLGVDRAVPLGLIASELITLILAQLNVNFGAGHLRVGLRCGTDEMCLLEVEGHDGAGSPRAGGASVSADELGMRLVQRLAGQIGARVEAGQSEHAGASWQVRMNRPPSGA
jgi:two-component sensor histidine kinase